MLLGEEGNDLIYGSSGLTNALSRTDLDVGDQIDGGAGDDTLVLGNDDVARGGSGADDFILGRWVLDGRASTILDFDETEDEIVVIYDTVLDANPQLTTTIGPPDGTQIFLNGEMIAEVENAALDPVEITLRGLELPN